MSSGRYGAVTPSVSGAARTETLTPNENISLPYGLIRAIEHYLSITGVLDLLDTYKCKGVSLSKLVLALCVHTLERSNSMSDCSRWLQDGNVLEELGISGNVGQRTLNRALTILGQHREEIIKCLWDGIQREFELPDTDVNLDGSAVTVYGARSELSEFGYPRDKNPGKEQVEFMVAELQTSRIPMYVRSFRGNASDPAQYRVVLPEIFEMIRKGSWIIMDNGGASSDILDSIKDSGNEYLTGVQMNRSDDERIVEEGDRFEYVEDGVCCLKHVFESSGRTTYIYHSTELAARKRHAAERKVRGMLEAAMRFEATKKVRASDFVSIKSNRFADVSVQVSVQTHLGYDDPAAFENMVDEEIGPRCGYFKLGSSSELTPEEALRKYRKRVTVEHLISSMKRVTGIKPLRVWKRGSIDGSMVLALLSEAVVGIAKYELEE